MVVVQQYCDKGTLDSAVQGGVFRGGGPSWPERVALRALLRTAAELARGLLHLHDGNVVHGDLKVRGLKGLEGPSGPECNAQHINLLVGSCWLSPAATLLP